MGKCGRRSNKPEGGRGSSSAREEQDRDPGGQVGAVQKPDHPRRARGHDQGEGVAGNNGILPRHLCPYGWRESEEHGRGQDQPKNSSSSRYLVNRTNIIFELQSIFASHIT